MPDRYPVYAAAQKAVKIGPAEGGTDLPLPGDSGHAWLMSLIGDPLGVGQPSIPYNGDSSGEQDAGRLPPLSPSDARYRELLDKFGGRAAGAVERAVPTLRDALGGIFTGGKLSEPIRLTTYDPSANSATFTGTRTGTPMQSTLSDAHKLLTGGGLNPEPGPYDSLSLERLIRQLLKMTKE